LYIRISPLGLPAPADKGRLLTVTEIRPKGVDPAPAAALEKNQFSAASASPSLWVSLWIFSEFCFALGSTLNFARVKFWCRRVRQRGARDRPPVVSAT
jgi:hypothetical protein